ncbi:hypothetical protein GCM10011396_17380 [Undibacterium terreum]|uniref:Uncharacterized protein n=1 Tax=Undibacterium terreum TaxID=1224302 RepID=A0A916XG33_9BURK|nr:hypothetical protein GCM10011396_17380 [Undibacterium terreum]
MTTMTIKSEYSVRNSEAIRVRHYKNGDFYYRQLADFYRQLLYPGNSDALPTIMAP